MLNVITEEAGEGKKGRLWGWMRPSGAAGFAGLVCRRCQALTHTTLCELLVVLGQQEAVLYGMAPAWVVVLMHGRMVHAVRRVCNRRWKHRMGRGVLSLQCTRVLLGSCAAAVAAASSRRMRSY